MASPNRYTTAHSEAVPFPDSLSFSEGADCKLEGFVQEVMSVSTKRRFLPGSRGTGGEDRLIPKRTTVACELDSPNCGNANGHPNLGCCYNDSSGQCLANMTPHQPNEQNHFPQHANTMPLSCLDVPPSSGSYYHLSSLVLPMPHGHNGTMEHPMQLCHPNFEDTELGNALKGSVTSFPPHPPAMFPTFCDKSSSAPGGLLSEYSNTVIHTWPQLHNAQGPFSAEPPTPHLSHRDRPETYVMMEVKSDPTDQSFTNDSSLSRSPMATFALSEPGVQDSGSCTMDMIPSGLPYNHNTCDLNGSPESDGKESLISFQSPSSTCTNSNGSNCAVGGTLGHVSPQDIVFYPSDEPAQSVMYQDPDSLHYYGSNCPTEVVMAAAENNIGKSGGEDIMNGTAGCHFSAPHAAAEVSPPLAINFSPYPPSLHYVLPPPFFPGMNSSHPCLTLCQGEISRGNCPPMMPMSQRSRRKSHRSRRKRAHGEPVEEGIHQATDSLRNQTANTTSVMASNRTPVLMGVFIILGHVLVAANLYGAKADPIDHTLVEEAELQRLREVKFSVEVKPKPVKAIDDFAEVYSEASPLSLVTDYVGVAYNYIRGNPDGDFNNGGLDPGLRLARNVFKLTYENEEEIYYKHELVAIPDQVDFQQVDTCSASEETGIFSGTESYQDKLDSNAQIEGKVNKGLGKYRFSLSTAYSAAESGTSKYKQVILEKVVVCNVGRARYLLDTALNNHYSVDDDFYYAVKDLPTSYNEDDYMQFIESWGTHILMEMDLGGKQTERSKSDYIELYEYAKLEVGNSVSAGAEYQGYSGSFKVDVKTFNEEVTSGAEFGSELHTVRSGSTIEEVSKGQYQVPVDDQRPPIPIRMTLRLITTALDERLWTVLPEDEETYESLGIADKLTNLEQALDDYPTWASAPESYDPDVIIPNAWPDGTYTLPKSDSGCPSGGDHFTWHTGRRFHDTDGSNKKSSSINLAAIISNNIEVEFCTKTDASGDYGIPWPSGSYCIAKKGSCPSGFESGYIFWDDKDKNNDNTASGVLPDGTYDANTRLYFCCRDDGFTSNPITLPTDKPFYLYRYDRTNGCQQVSGTSVREDWVLWNNMHKRNDDKRVGAYPYTDGNNTHKIRYCYYKPKK